MTTGLAGHGVRVVLAGTGSHVAGSTLPDVPAVAGTVAALRRLLVDVCGTRDAAIRTVVDPDSPEPLLDAVIAAAGEASDVLLLYYVGHGVHDAAMRLHLATRATVGSTMKIAYQALPFAIIAEVLADCSARTVLVILDCCYSGGATNPLPSGALLASADREGYALAPEGEPYTAFSGALIEALRGGVPTAPADLRLQSLFDHLNRTMRGRGRPAPVLRVGNNAADLIIAPNQAYRSPQPADEAAVPPWEGGCPYRGLEPYAAEDHLLFYGRERLTGKLIEQIGAAAIQGGISIVSGPSGSGKTSLLSAGVIPRLLDGASGSWSPVTVVPGTDPLGGLADALVELDPLQDAHELRQRLAAHPDAFIEALQLGRAGGRLRGERVLLLVDRFEDVFAPEVTETDRRAVIDALAAACAPSGPGGPAAVVVICLRSGFDGFCARYPQLTTALEQRTVVVGPMTTGELREAIEAPAARLRYLLEPGLTELLLRDAGARPDDDDAVSVNPGVMPLLSHALLGIWQRRHGRTLRVAGYTESGGVSGAVATTAEHVYAGLAPAVREAAQAVLLRMVHLGDGVPDTRLRLSTDSITETTRDALHAFAQARLVTLDSHGAEITHEAVISSWPRLRQWIDGNRKELLARQELDAAAQRWSRADEDPTLLLAAPHLKRLRGHAGALDDTIVHQFFAASARRHRRLLRLRGLVAAALIVLVAATATTVLVARDRGERLDRQRAANNARALAIASDTRATDRPGYAARLALAAWRSDPTSPDARGALVRRYLATRSFDRTFDGIAARAVDRLLTSRDGTTAALLDVGHVTIVTGLLGDTAQTWNVPGVTQGRGAKLSPDGRWLFAATAGDGVGLWDVRAHAGPFLLPGSDGTHIARPVVGEFDEESGRLLVLGGRALGVWRTDDRTTIAASPHVLPGVEPEHAWFTTDPDRILIEVPGTVRDRLETRSLNTGKTLQAFPEGAVAAGNGRWVLQCTANTDGESWHGTVVSADRGAPTATLPDDISPDCTVDLTSDGGHTELTQRASEPYKAVRVASLATGTSWDFVMPDTGVLDTSQDDAHTVVVDRPAGGPLMFMAIGTSIVRLTAITPDWLPHALTSATLSDDDRYLVTKTKGLVEVYDARSGEQLGRLSASDLQADTELTYVSTNGIPHAIERTDGRWQLSTFALPHLTLDQKYVVPGTERSSLGNLALTTLGDTRLVTAVGDQLAFWDTTTGALTAGPFTLGTSPQQREQFQRSVHVMERPAHPGQLIVFTPTEPMQIWDAAKGAHTGIVPATAASATAVAFDSTGNRLAILGRDHTLELWDVDARHRVIEPFPAPDTDQLLGFTADGYLATVDSRNDNRIDLWELNGRRSSGAVPVETTASLDNRTADPILVGGDSTMPTRLPLSAEAWSSALCRTFGAGFTNAELVDLPPGVNRSNPCAP